MGNTTSCTPSIITSSSGVKTLAPFTGTLKVYSRPVTASDIVSQDSGHFIADSTALEIGLRVVAVAPREVLRPRRELYLVLPMDMLFSVLTHEELAVISRKATEALTLHHNVTRQTHLKRIFPVCMFPTERRRRRRRSSSSVEEDGFGDDDDDNNNGGFVEMSETLMEEKLQELRHGSWRPSLETIVES